MDKPKRIDFVDADGMKNISKANVQIVEDVDEHETVKSWLSYCRTHTHLVKILESEVPEGILPKPYKGTLIDVKVSTKGPDDKAYCAHKDLRDKIARGNCVLEVKESGKIQVQYYFMVFALKKFSGGMGDEDDFPSSQNMWQNYFIQPLETAKKVICTRKANGEAGHVSSRRLFDKNFYCIGSKNVHLLVRSKEDIPKYTDSRYLVARTVAETFFRQVIENEETGSNKIDMLVTFLQENKFTMVSEMLQPKYQHIENLSYLQDPELRFICWTTYKSVGECDNLCSLPPNLALDQASGFGLKTVDYEIIDPSTAEQYMNKIRSDFEYEGRVLYFLDSNDNVIGAIKKKTAWYIILRAIREKTCHFCSKKDSTSQSERKSKITKRIGEIQKWVGFSDSYQQLWTKLGVAFAEWILTSNTRQQGSVAVRAQFPILWKQFLDSDSKWETIYSQLQESF